MGKPVEKVLLTNDDCELGKPPGGNSVAKVAAIFTSPMTSRQIQALAPCSQSVACVVVKFMRKAGDLTTDGIIHTPTGSTNLLKEYLARPHRSNTGVTGVSFNAKTKVFTCSFGRGYITTFKTLFDAVCQRKSLELSS